MASPCCRRVPVHRDPPRAARPAGRRRPVALHRGGSRRRHRDRHLPAERQFRRRGGLRLQAGLDGSAGANAPRRCWRPTRRWSSPATSTSARPTTIPRPARISPTDALVRPESRARYRRLLWLGLTDAVRALHPPVRVYTFWDYQAGAWQRDMRPADRPRAAVAHPGGTAGLRRTRPAGTRRAPAVRSRPGGHRVALRPALSASAPGPRPTGGHSSASRPEHIPRGAAHHRPTDPRSRHSDGRSSNSGLAPNSSHGAAAAAPRRVAAAAPGLYGFGGGGGGCATATPMPSRAKAGQTATNRLIDPISCNGTPMDVLTRGGNMLSRIVTRSVGPAAIKHSRYKLSRRSSAAGGRCRTSASCQARNCPKGLGWRPCQA